VVTNPQKAFTAELKRYFRNQGQRVVSKLSRAGSGESHPPQLDADSLIDVESETQLLRDGVRPHLARALAAGAVTGLADVEKAFKPAKKSIEIVSRILIGAGLPDELRPQLMVALTEIEAAQYWMQIGESTRDSIAALLDEAKEQGWDGLKLSAKIKGEFKAFATDRAEMIAITESVAATNNGAMRAAVYAQQKNPGSVIGKAWRTQGDEKVRESHQKMDGVRVPAETDFTLPNGESAAYPVDIRLSAKDRCGCRCTIQAVVIKKGDDDYVG